MAYEVGDCTLRGDRVKKLSNRIWMSHKDDFSWRKERTSYAPIVCVEVTNKTSVPIRVIRWEGVQSGSVFTLYNDYYDKGGAIEPDSTDEDCQHITERAYKEDSQAHVSFYEYGYQQGPCLGYYTKEEKERKLIFDGCMASKSKGATSASIKYIRKECRNISKDPNSFHKWRWGS